MEVADVVKAVEAVKAGTGFGEVKIVIKNQAIKAIHETKIHN